MVTPQAPPSMGFSRQDYWRGLPFPSPADLLDPGIEPRSPLHYSAIRKSETLPFTVAWVDLDGLMTNEISQTEKGKYLYVITCMWNLKNTTASEYNKKDFLM